MTIGKNGERLYTASEIASAHIYGPGSGEAAVTLGLLRVLSEGAETSERPVRRRAARAIVRARERWGEARLVIAPPAAA